MANWTRHADGRLETGIGGERYRANLHSSRQGGDWWAAEVMHRGEWTRIGSLLESERACAADIEDYARHLAEKSAFGRPSRSFSPGRGTSTPWGRAQCATSYGPGVTSYDTAGHGGFKVSDARNMAMPSALRNANGWYEEDAEWARVALAFPNRFTGREKAHAERSLRDWDPDAWEAHFGRGLVAGESAAKDARIALAAHAEDWIVIAAVSSDGRKGMVECWATVGGDRNGEEKRFYVPADEYATRTRIGFVIDPDRHEEIGAENGAGLSI